MLKWILDRCEGTGSAVETLIGHVPTLDAIDRTGTGLTEKDMATLLKVDPAEWVEAVTGQGDFFALFGDRIPKALVEQHARLGRRLEEAITPPELRGHDHTH